MEEHSASQAWAEAARAWAKAATAWEDAVKKNPHLSRVLHLSDVRALWGSAWRLWASAAVAWAPGPGDSWLPGNHPWSSESYYWATAALRWALASERWAFAVEMYPKCAVDAALCAKSAFDWASAAVAWANPHTIWEKPLCEWAKVACLFAESGERAADVAAWAQAGRELPPFHDHHVSVAAPVAKVPPFPANPSAALAGSVDPATEESADSNHAAPSVAGAKPSVTEKALPQDQARGDEAGTSVAGKGSVAVDRAGAGRELPSLHNHHQSVAASVAKVPPSPANPSVAAAENPATEESADSARENHAAPEDTAPSVAGAKPTVTEKALPQDQARRDEACTSVAGKVSVAVDRAAAEEIDKAESNVLGKGSVAVDRAAAEKTGKAESNVLDLKNPNEYPALERPNPGQQKAPKALGQRDQPRRQLFRGEDRQG